MKRENLDDTEKYYVYGLYDPKTYLPFYVGKGSGSRKRHHLSWKSTNGNNPHKDNKIAKIKREGREPYSEIIWDKLKEAKAFDREWGLIHILDVCPNVSLTNIAYTWGHSGPKLKGENHPMRKRGHTEEAKQKISEATSGENHPFYGCSHTEESIRKMSESSKGIFPSEKTREKMGKSRRGQNNGNTKLEKQEAREIKWLAQKSDMTHKEIGNEYNVGRTTVTAINVERFWKYIEAKKPSQEKTFSKEHIENMSDEKNHNTKLTDQEAAEVRWLVQNTDMFQKNIGKKYDVSQGTVSRISLGKTYEHVKPKKNS